MRKKFNRTRGPGKPSPDILTLYAMTDENVIKNAQYRKNLSIAFFNATNSAIELVKTDYIKDTDLKKFIVDWRDWFLEEHKKYYAETIANIGGNYNTTNTIAKLGTAKNVEELKTIWLNLSEDERRDPEIFKATQDLKNKLS